MAECVLYWSHWGVDVIRFSVLLNIRISICADSPKTYTRPSVWCVNFHNSDVDKFCKVFCFMGRPVLMFLNQQITPELNRKMTAWRVTIAFIPGIDCSKWILSNCHINISYTHSIVLKCWTLHFTFWNTWVITYHSLTLTIAEGKRSDNNKANVQPLKSLSTIATIAYLTHSFLQLSKLVGQTLWSNGLLYIGRLSVCVFVCVVCVPAIPYTGNIKWGKKSWAVHQNFPRQYSQIHWKCIMAYALTVAYSPNFSSPIAFTCTVCQIYILLKTSPMDSAHYGCHGITEDVIAIGR